jgi:hypothetical protein
MGLGFRDTELEAILSYNNKNNIHEYVKPQLYLPLASYTVLPVLMFRNMLIHHVKGAHFVLSKTMGNLWVMPLM